MVSMSCPSSKALPCRSRWSARSYGALLIFEPTMNRNPACSSASRFAADNIPASATTMISPVSGWVSRNSLRTGMRVLVSALLPSNRCTASGNPVRSVSSPTVTCVDSAFLGHADLAQPVLAWGLEVQGGHVVEHQPQRAGVAGVAEAVLGDRDPVVINDDAFEAAHERRQRR